MRQFTEKDFPNPFGDSQEDINSGKTQKWVEIISESHYDKKHFAELMNLYYDMMPKFFKNIRDISIQTLGVEGLEYSSKEHRYTDITYIVTFIISPKELTSAEIEEAKTIQIPFIFSGDFFDNIRDEYELKLEANLGQTQKEMFELVEKYVEDNYELSEEVNRGTHIRMAAKDKEGIIRVLKDNQHLAHKLGKEGLKILVYYFAGDHCWHITLSQELF